MFEPLNFSNLCTRLRDVTVKSPLVGKLGIVELKSLYFPAEFVIKNDIDEVVLRVEGPTCSSWSCGNLDFKVGGDDLSFGPV